MKSEEKNRGLIPYILAVLTAFFVVLLALSFFNVIDLSYVFGEKVESVEYMEDLPEVYIGTSRGGVYHLAPGESPERVTDLNHGIREIDFAGSRPILATYEDTTASEESGNSVSNVRVFNSSGSYRIKVSSSLNDIEAQNNTLFVSNPANHSHGPNSDHRHEGDLSQGSIDIYSISSGELVSQVAFRSAYMLNTYPEGIVATSEDGRVALYSLDQEKIVRSFKAGIWAGEAVKTRERILSTSRENIVNQGPNGNLEKINVTHGFVKILEDGSSDPELINLGVTSVPHNIRTYSNDSAVITDSAGGKVRFIDLDSLEVTKTVTLDDDLTDMIIEEDYAYIVGTRDRKIYEINLDTQNLSREIEIPAITSIARAPDQKVTWSQ